MSTDGRSLPAAERLEKAANSARVTIYAIDPTLVTERYRARTSSRNTIGVDMDRLEGALGKLDRVTAVSQAEDHIYALYFMAIDESGRVIDRAQERVTRQVPGPPDRPSTYLRDLVTRYVASARGRGSATQT